jgi:hypothetical protein
MVRRWRSAFALFTLCALGCGGSGNVSGKVYYMDAPLPAGKVVFQQGNVFVHADIKSDGSYDAVGVPRGEVKVGVLPPAKEIALPIKKGAKDDAPKTAKNAPAKFSAQYSDPAKSGLTLTVTKGDNPPFDIKLTK